jgi:hypothetical protein
MAQQSLQPMARPERRASTRFYDMATWFPGPNVGKTPEKAQRAAFFSQISRASRARELLLSYPVRYHCAPGAALRDSAGLPRYVAALGLFRL